MKCGAFKLFRKLEKRLSSSGLEHSLVLKDSLAAYLVIFALTSFTFYEPAAAALPRVEALTHPLVSLSVSYAEDLQPISLPQQTLLDVGPLTLPSLPANAPKLVNTAAAANSNTAQVFSNTLQTIKRAITSQFESIDDSAQNAPTAPAPRSAPTAPTRRTNSAPARQLESLPSTLNASLRGEIDAYVRSQIASQGNALLNSLRASITRQSDAEATRRSNIVTTISQEGDFENPVITGGSIAGATASFASLAGAGLTTCQSNNVLTWADGQFGCETDDTGAGSGGSSASHFATSTNGVAIYPNAASAVVIGASATTTTGAELEVQGDLYVSASTTLQAFTFTNATGTSATTTNFFATTASSTNLFSASAIFGNLLLNGSSTLQRFTFTTATGTSATTTSFFSTTASSTSLFFTTATGGTFTSNGLGTFNNLLLNASTTLQAFTFTTATGTSATTTNFFATTASSTNLFSAAATFGSLLINPTASSTLQRFTFTTATGTSATTTNFFATTASTTNLFVGGPVVFAGLAATTTPGSSVCFGNAVGARGNLTQTNGSTACGSLSSRRFKDDIQSLGSESGLAEVMALRPVSYKYKPSYLGGFIDNPNWNGTFVGFVAEEIQEVDARLINVDEQGIPNAVQYDKMVAILTKAIQEQQAMIEEISQDANDSLNTLLGVAEGNDLSSVGTSAYFAAVWQAVAARLADATESVEALVANRLKAKNEICINDTCINEAQLQALLSQCTPPPAPPAPPAEPDPVPGCMDSAATNYNASATQDDGSCEYPPPENPAPEGGENP